MPIQAAIQLLKFAEFMETILATSGETFQQLSSRWRVPQTTLRGWRNGRGAPFDQVCEIFPRMSLAEQDLLIGSMTRRVPAITFSRQAPVETTPRDSMLILADLNASAAATQMLILDRRIPPREKCMTIQQHHQQRCRLSEELTASMERTLMRNAT